MKALSLAPDDENLYFNVARACYEKGDAEKSGAFARKALSLNPKLQEAQRLLQALERHCR
jgi:tetratricopeptide (TPR) repeat protein